VQWASRLQGAALRVCYVYKPNITVSVGNIELQYSLGLRIPINSLRVNGTGIYVGFFEYKIYKHLWLIPKLVK
jgi:hypothetical protein